MIYVLLAFTIILMLLSIVIFDRDIIAPGFLLTAAFCFSTLFASINSNIWGFSDARLILVIISGLSSFLIFAGIEYLLCKRGKKVVARKIVPINISKYKLWGYLIFQLLLYGLLMATIVQNVGKNGALSYMINTYYEMNRTGDISYSSSIVNIGNILNFSGTYYILYVAMNNLKCKKKNSFLIWLNVAVGMIGSLLTGTKTAFFMYAIAGIIFYVRLVNKENGWKRNINLKTIVKLSIGAFIGLVIFGVIDSAQGRGLEDMSVLYKISTYIGAPIKNLELFISDNIHSHEIFGAQTLSKIYGDLYEITGNNIFKINSMYTYRWVSGDGLGNVYTLFMPLYYDFGLTGVIVIMGLLGLFSQRIYDKIKYGKIVYDLDFRSIFYGYLAFTIIFSFFSNKIFECIFSKSGVYFFIGLFLFDFVFKRMKGTKVSIRKRIHRVRKRISN